jgi:hypothetical protein
VAFLSPRLVEQLLLLLLLIAQALAAGSLLVRFRGSRGVERQQIKWVASAAVLLGLQQAGLVVVHLAGLVGPDRPPPFWVNVIQELIFGFFFVAIAVAVLRYRLYELDRIINRTLVYGLLTALLGGTYAGLVLVLGQLLGQELSSLAVAAATLAAAALFQPAATASSRPSTAGSTGAATTPPRPWRRSAPGYVTRSTWTRFRVRYLPWWMRRCSRPRRHVASAPCPRGSPQHGRSSGRTRGSAWLAPSSTIRQRDDRSGHHGNASQRCRTGALVVEAGADNPARVCSAERTAAMCQTLPALDHCGRRSRQTA